MLQVRGVIHCSRVTRLTGWAGLQYVSPTLAEQMDRGAIRDPLVAVTRAGTQNCIDFGCLLMWACQIVAPPYSVFAAFASFERICLLAEPGMVSSLASCEAFMDIASAHARSAVSS